MKRILIFVLFLVLHSVLLAQDSATFFMPLAGQPWTLQQCILQAQTSNLQVRQAQLNAQNAQINLQQSKANLLPNVNANASHTYQYGRTVDRFTNSFANDRVLSQNFYLSSNLVLFSGMQNYNAIQQNRYNFQSGMLQVEQTQYDIGMNVASAYLNILYAEEQLHVAETQVKITADQVARMQKMVDAGAVAKGNLLSLQSQLAQEELALVNAKNNVMLAYLTLTQLLNLDSAAGFAIVKPDLAAPVGNMLTTSPEQIYQSALQAQPAIKKAEVDFMSADKGVDIAYGGLSPTLSVTGSIGTGYSGLSKTVESSTYSGNDTVGVTTGGDFVLVPTFNNTFQVVPFSDQLDNNLNKAIGLQLTVPIFNRMQTSSNISRAKIQRESAQVNIDLAQQQLRKNVEQAYADANAAWLRWQASEKAVQAQQEAFRYTEEKFNAGVLNAVDYNTEKNKLAKAQADLIQAKFDYIFRLKVLDYYQGKPITF